MVQVYGMPNFISFDHDLGKNEPTGYDIAKWLVEVDMGRNKKILDRAAFHPDFDFYVHSKNPVGKANIEAYLNNYFKMKAEQ